MTCEKHENWHAVCPKCAHQELLDAQEGFADYKYRSEVLEKERDEARAEVARLVRLHDDVERYWQEAEERLKDVAERQREACASWFVSNLENAAADAHAAYQREAHRRGDVRHADNYDDLPDATKEWDRVLCRWASDAVRAIPLVTDKNE